MSNDNGDSGKGTGTDGGFGWPGRRDFLKATAATAVSAGAATTTASATHYDEVIVPAGEKYSKFLSAGETWGNVLIDITASGAYFLISTEGNNCTIHDVGIRGVWDSDVGDPAIWAWTTDPNGGVLVENVYYADGNAHDSYPDGNSGIWVAPQHEGTVTIRNLNYQDNPENAVYGSAPGNPDEHDSPGAGGVVIIEDSYSRNHSSSGFRLGTDGSYAKNCVGVGGNRPGWAYYNDVEYIDCDFSQADIGDITAGNGFWSNKGNAHMTNCRYVTEAGIDGGQVFGDPVGRPQRFDPDEVEGVPLTPEEAAEGGGADGGDTFEDVAEDFAHNDVAGTYAGDTGAFTTTATRSTSDDYSLVADDDADGSRIIVRDDMGTTAGNTYDLDVYFNSDSNEDMGFLFGRQSGTSWGSYTGYLGFFDSNADEIRIDRWSDGSQVATSSRAVSWPTGEWLGVELDYRETDTGTITMTVSDASGSALGSVSLSDTTHDSGTIGWYNYNGAADWHADTWFNAQAVTDVAEDFSHNDVPATYAGDTGSFTTSATRSTSDSYSLVADDDADGSQVILRDDMQASAGNAYDLDVYFPSSSGNDMGILFGAQDGVTSWSDYTGYLAFFDDGAHEIRVDRWDNGGRAATSSTAVSWPSGEWLEVEIDYRDSVSDTITMTVYDAGSAIGSVSLSDTTHDSGTIGWYNYFAAADWHADTWFDVQDPVLLEGFGHNDVAGTYAGDTGAFTTSSSRATSDSYSLHADSSSDGARIILHDTQVTRAGTTYEYDIYFPSGPENDTGVLFGAQSGATGWSDYTGYLAFFDDGAHEIRVDRWSDGSQAATSSSALSWPTDEWLTVEIDYRESNSSDVTMAVSDASGSQLGSTTLADNTHDSGGLGWYDYFAAADWYADSWRESGSDA